MSFAKFGAVGAVAAAGTTGTYFLVWGTDPEPEVSFTLSNLTSTESSSYDSNKVGKQYEYFLVAPDKEENKNWWEWSYRRGEKEAAVGESNLHDEFKKAKLNGAFSSNTASEGSTKALNKVCDDIYKKSKDDVGIDKTEENKKNLTKNLFRYCSILGDLPSTVKDESQVADSGKIGKDEEQKLIATKNGINMKFWEVKGKGFNDLKVTDKSEYFGKTVETDSGQKSLRAACEESYSSNTSESTDGKPKKDNVVKYCSLDTSGVTRAS